MRKILFLLFIFALSQIPCLSQQTKNHSVEFEQSKPFDIKDYGSWQKVDAEEFKFYIPLILKKKETRCFHGDCYHYEGGDLNLWVSLNTTAVDSPLWVDSPSYSRKFTQIDGKIALIWFYEDERDYKYHTGIHFWNEEAKRWGANIRLDSKTANIKQTAQKLFESIKFNKSSKL